jgi:hypothetical protein
MINKNDSNKLMQKIGQLESELANSAALTTSIAWPAHASSLGHWSRRLR